MSTKDKFDITDKVAVITGGAGLLGKEFAKTLLEYGGQVVIADISKDAAKGALRDILKEKEGEISYEYVDVRSKQSVESMVKSVVRRLRKIDILVNCAAVDPKFEDRKKTNHTFPFEDYPLNLWEETIAVNLTGAFLCCQAVGKVMVRGEGGVIVNIASDLGIIAPDQRIYLKNYSSHRREYKPVDYPVTKAGLIHLSRYLASYWGDKNIRVNSLSPASVYTNQDPELVKNISYRTVLGRLSGKDEFCAALIFLVSDASSYMTGANLVVDGGRTIW